MAGSRGSGLPKLQEELIAWLLHTKADRRALGLPGTEKEWADWKGVTARTTRRWKEQPEFIEVLEQRRIAAARQLTPGSTVASGDVGGARAAKDARTKRRYERDLEAVVTGSAGDDGIPDEELTQGEVEYRRVKRALLAAVEDGSTQAASEYLKRFGQVYIDAEHAQLERQLDLDDERLVDEVVAMLGPDVVAESLARAMG